MNYPLPVDEEQRLEELRRYALLDTPPEKAFDDITALAARVFEVPIAAVTLIDSEREWFKSCVGLETREVGRNYAFCAYAILGTEIMIVPDARMDPRFAESPLVTGPPHIVFYAGAPLRTRSGLALGTLTVSDVKPRSFPSAKIALLASLAELVVAEIELRHDIGERGRAADTLRLLQAAIQQSTESVIITTAEIDSPGPEIVFVNSAFTRLTGFTAEEVVGKTPRLMQGQKTERAVLDRVHEQLAEKKEFHFDAINYRKDGSEFMLSTDIAPIRNDRGMVTHFICFQRDTTERERTAAALRQAKEEAERANHAKSEFLSRMSHELRTPLHAILGFAELLEMDERTPGDAEGLGQIIRAGKHLLGLINDVLDLARVESGKLALTLEPVSVRGTLEETLSLMKPLAGARGVTLKPLSGELDCEVISSALQFKQVMLNLLSNAVKFTPRGGHVAVTCEKTEDRLRITVADTGRGISAENIPKLFEPFERLDIAGSISEGAGLGLSLSKRLVEAIGGRIDVTSALGHGTAFSIDLPLHQGTPAGTAQNSEAPTAEFGRGRRPTAPRTLLYIEDNLSNLRLVERILARRPELTLLSAMRGSLGLELARQHLPDLILLDLHLPDIQGDEVLRRLRADPLTATIPVIVVSADATATQKDRLHAAGANAYLTKPINVRKFLATIDETALGTAH